MLFFCTYLFVVEATYRKVLLFNYAMLSILPKDLKLLLACSYFMYKLSQISYKDLYWIVNFVSQTVQNYFELRYRLSNTD